MSRITSPLFSKFALIAVFFLLAQSLNASAVLPVQAQSNSEFDVTIQIGFDGHCKFGYWLPIYIVLSSKGSYFTGTLSIAYSQAEYLIPVSLTPNAQKSISTQIFTNISDVNQTVTLELIPEQEGVSPILLERKNLTCISNRIVGVITDTPSAISILNSLQPANSTKTGRRYADWFC